MATDGGSGAEPRKPAYIFSDAEEQAFYESVRIIQGAGLSNTVLDGWAEEYERRQANAAEAALDEADGEFVILLANTQVGRIVRAIGPIIGRVTAEGFALRLLEQYRREWSDYTVEWSSQVVPFDSDVAGREEEMTWIESGRPEEGAADYDDGDAPEQS